ncbi:putative phosphosugar isomerase [Alphaproteobacteria bacterium]|nr:putative phosphosugar isomerase [Alphaproteobacteria bacterium]
MNDAEILTCGADALDKEIAGLEAVRDGLDDSFTAAVRRIVATRKSGGTVIVCGMGKSGHIGRKITATLVSLDIPAAFLHAGEAGHGDLGILRPGDAMIMISYSGNTKELAPAIEAAALRGVPLIAITANRDSLLGRAADIWLPLPKLPEADPNDQAPTTSSTATLGLGDALAVAASVMLGLTREGFARHHSSGSLGLEMKPVEEFMWKDAKHIPLCALDTAFQQVMAAITNAGLGAVNVVDADRRLLGVVSDGDLRRSLERYQNGVFSITAKEMMTPDPTTIAPSATLKEAGHLMLEREISFLPVVGEDNKVRGMLHIHDLRRAKII